VDQAPEPLGERHPARLDPDERDVLQLGVRLDDLVRDPAERPRDRLAVEEQLLLREARAQGATVVVGTAIIRLLPGLAGPS